MNFQVIKIVQIFCASAAGHSFTKGGFLVLEKKSSGLFSGKSALEALQEKRRVLEEGLSNQIWDGKIPKS